MMKKKTLEAVAYNRVNTVPCAAVFLTLCVRPSALVYTVRKLKYHVRGLI